MQGSTAPPLPLPHTLTQLRFLGVVTPYAVTMGTVGLLESLLTVQLLDGLVDDGRRGSTRKECVGQGLGNVVAGLEAFSSSQFECSHTSNVHILQTCADILQASPPAWAAARSSDNRSSMCSRVRLQPCNLTPRRVACSASLHLAAPRCTSLSLRHISPRHGRRHLAAVGRRDVSIPRCGHLRRRAYPGPGGFATPALAPALTPVP